MSSKATTVRLASLTPVEVYVTMWSMINTATAIQLALPIPGEYVARMNAKPSVRIFWPAARPTLVTNRSRSELGRMTETKKMGPWTTARQT